MKINLQTEALNKKIKYHHNYVSLNSPLISDVKNCDCTTNVSS